MRSKIGVLFLALTIFSLHSPAKQITCVQMLKSPEANGTWKTYIAEKREVFLKDLTGQSYGPYAGRAINSSLTDTIFGEENLNYTDVLVFFNNDTLKNGQPMVAVYLMIRANPEKTSIGGVSIANGMTPELLASGFIEKKIKELGFLVSREAKKELLEIQGL